MKLGTIMFDEKIDTWENNRDYNFMLLRHVEQRVNDLVRNRGYIYLNQIYETLGVNWNPEHENPCIIADNRDRIVFVEFEVFSKPNNSYLVIIHNYQQNETES